MRKQDYLIHLIHSLTPSEKRYFKIFCQSQSGGTKYLRLFNALEKATTYNGAAIAKLLNMKTGNLAHEKDYLQEVLLRNLRLFHETNFIESKMMGDFVEAELLYRKGLTTYSISRAEKLLERTLKYERFGLSLNITRLLSRLYYSTGRYDEAAEMNNREKQLLEAMTEYMELVHLRDRFMAPVFNRTGFGALKDIAQHPLFKKDTGKLLSWHARHCQNELGVFYYQYVEPNGERTLQHALNQLELFKQAPHFIIIVPTAYYGLFSKLCIRQYGLGNYREALSWANKLIEETQKVRDNVPALTTERYNMFGKTTKMTLLSLLHQFNEARTFGQQAYSVIEHIKPGERLTFLFDYAISLFYTGDYDACHTELNKLIDEKTTERLDVQLYARLLFIQLQIQIKNYSLVPYQVKSARAWKKRVKTDIPGANYLLGWLDKLGKAGQQDNLELAFAAFKEALQQAPLAGLDKELALGKWNIKDVQKPTRKHLTGNK